MQDQYTGDVGDFGKYGLLRYLAGLNALPEQAALSIGVIWYKTEDGHGNPNDGRHVSYKAKVEEYKKCDPSLFQRMQEMPDAVSLRSLGLVEQSNILGAARFFSDLVPRHRSERENWFRAARRKVEACDLVFLDPDNGVCVNDGCTRKHVTIQELKSIADANHKLVVIYHHLGRNGSHSDQIRELSSRLATECGARSIFALRYRRGTSRAFFILACEEMKNQTRNLLDEFVSSAWEKHFERHY